MSSKRAASDDDDVTQDRHKDARSDESADVGTAHCEVTLPAVYVLERRHVAEAIEGARIKAGVREDGEMWTLWIHDATIGIADGCFERMGDISRILSSRRAPAHLIIHPPSSPTLGALMKKIESHEQDLYDLIHEFAEHNIDNIDSRFTGCVGERAFNGCTGLTEVVLPNSLARIGNRAFQHCSWLTAVTLPTKVTHIGDRAFSGCKGLTEVTLPNSLTRIGKSTFYNCTGLTEVTLPDSLTHIEDGAFSGCTGLTEVTLPDSLTHIGRESFSGCTGLTEVSLPDSLTHIGGRAFGGCIRLMEMVLPDKLIYICGGAFSGCTGLKEIPPPDTLKCFGWSESGHSEVRVPPKSLTHCASSGIVFVTEEERKKLGFLTEEERKKLGWGW